MSKTDFMESEVKRTQRFKIVLKVFQKKGKGVKLYNFFYETEPGPQSLVWWNWTITRHSNWSKWWRRGCSFSAVVTMKCWSTRHPHMPSHAHTKLSCAVGHNSWWLSAKWHWLLFVHRSVSLHTTVIVLRFVVVSEMEGESSVSHDGHSEFIPESSDLLFCWSEVDSGLGVGHFFIYFIYLLADCRFKLFTLVKSFHLLWVSSLCPFWLLLPCFSQWDPTRIWTSKNSPFMILLEKIISFQMLRLLCGCVSILPGLSTGYYGMENDSTYGPNMQNTHTSPLCFKARHANMWHISRSTFVYFCILKKFDICK